MFPFDDLRLLLYGVTSRSSNSRFFRQYDYKFPNALGTVFFAAMHVLQVALHGEFFGPRRLREGAVEMTRARDRNLPKR